MKEAPDGGAVKDLPFLGEGEICRLELPGDVAPLSDRFWPGNEGLGFPGISLAFPLSASFSFAFLSGVSSSDSES